MDIISFLYDLLTELILIGGMVGGAIIVNKIETYKRNKKDDETEKK